ncbi:unnamed protein product [Thlaspi arvense]|uniref:F-box domain-containing protein n=1 Tax=Thlaspi arvense TaxID=13288 RepID=A0AAU9R6B0_THLAR|nr:unnamed protein product [Thlaspi arvense]
MTIVTRSLPLSSLEARHKKFRYRIINNDDRISKLPDELLHDILSRLSTKEATLKNHCGPLESCIIHHYLSQYENGTLESWINIATRMKDTKDLTLVNHNYHGIDERPRAFRNCSNLKTLKLLDSVITQATLLTNVLAACPSLECKSYKESSVAEYLSAKAAGWNTRLIVETWRRGDPIATSVGLAIAAIHTCGRHVCIVPDEESRTEYENVMKRALASEATEVVVGESAEDVVERLSGVDFMVVDSKRREFVKALGLANTSERAAVLVCKNATHKFIPGLKWHGVLRRGIRVPLD